MCRCGTWMLYSYCVQYQLMSSSGPLDLFFCVNFELCSRTVHFYVHYLQVNQFLTEGCWEYMYLYIASYAIWQPSQCPTWYSRYEHVWYWFCIVTCCSNSDDTEASFCNGTVKIIHVWMRWTNPLLAHWVIGAIGVHLYFSEGSRDTADCCRVQLLENCYLPAPSVAGSLVVGWYVTGHGMVGWGKAACGAKTAP